MTTSKMQAAADIIVTGALEALAAKHGLTVMQVAAAIDAGDVRANEQFAALVHAGIAEALALHRAGKISLG